MRKVKNILVTGGAGFIGSAFIRFMLSDKLAFSGIVVNLDALTYAGNLENVAAVSGDLRYFFEKGNICQDMLVKNLCQKYEIDTIVHFAAETHVDNSISDPLSFAQTNVMGTLQILEAVKELKNIHLHHISTDEVFGELDQTGFFTEESPYEPRSPYAASKAAADHFVRAYINTYGISACISNCSNNFGPYQNREKLIPLMIDKALHSQPMPIYGNGLNVRDWLFVDDHILAIKLLLSRGVPGKSYNIGGGCQLTNRAIVEMLLNILSQKLEVPLESLTSLISYVEDRPGHDFRYAIDYSYINQEFGWQPKASFASALEQTVDWYLEQSKVRCV